MPAELTTMFQIHDAPIAIGSGNEPGPPADTTCRPANSTKALTPQITSQTTKICQRYPAVSDALQLGASNVAARSSMISIVTCDHINSRITPGTMSSTVPIAIG